MEVGQTSRTTLILTPIPSVVLTKSSGVCGGDACIRHTRIPVWALVQLRQLGTDEADLLRTYPTLTADDLVNAWSYYQSYTEEIDQQIADNESA